MPQINKTIDGIMARFGKPSEVGTPYATGVSDLSSGALVDEGDEALAHSKHVQTQVEDPPKPMKFES